MTIMENQKTVSQWAQATFDSATIGQVATRMLCESAELTLSTLHGLSKESLDECADIGVMLLQVAEHLDVRIDAVPLSEPEWPAEDSFHGVHHWALMLNHALAKLAAGIESGWMNQRRPHLQQLCRLCAQHLASMTTLLGEPVAMRLIEAKMAVNRARSWSRDEHGLFQHTGESL